MVAPTKIKTWFKYSAWLQVGDGPPPQSGQSSDSSVLRLIMYLIKTQMLAAGWEVVSSCGYYDSAWHYGAADHWPDAASVRWKEADNKFGWIILKNTNLHAGGNGFQVMFVLSGLASEPKIMNMYTSIEGGFSGGSETVRPTATDEVTIYGGSDYWYSSTGAAVAVCPIALNIWYSSDGQSFRMWGASSILPFNLGQELYFSLHPMMFERLIDAPIWMDKPVVAGIMRWRNDPMSNESYVFNYQRRLFFCCDDVISCGAMLVSEGISNGLLINHADSQGPDMGGNWTVYPVSVISLNRMVPGVIGKLVDFWVVPIALASGDYFPGNGSRDLVVIQNVLLGNDGTSVTIP